MRLLAFDTATDAIHLAVVVDDRVLARVLPGGAAASTALLPALQQALAEAGLTLGGLDAMAFGRGPGAFTGLRTACAVAQGLAVGADCPLIAIDTLQAVAEAARQVGATGPVWAANDARMGEVYAQRCRPVTAGDAGGTDWLADSPVALYAPQAWADAIAAAPADVAGNALSAYPSLTLPAGLRTWPQAAPTGEALAALARRSFAAGHFVDPAAALPLYVRDKVAQTTAERSAAR